MPLSPFVGVVEAEGLPETKATHKLLRFFNPLLGRPIPRYFFV